jgi:hypothetical protein
MTALITFAFLGLVEASNLAKRQRTEAPAPTTFVTFTLSSPSSTTTVVEALATASSTSQADIKTTKPHVLEVICILILLIVFISSIYLGCQFCHRRKTRIGYTSRRAQIIGWSHDGREAVRTTQPNVTEIRTHSSWVS